MTPPTYQDNSEVYGCRALLNPPGHHGTGAIVAEVTKRDYGWEAILKISDCDRTITLSLYGPTAADHDHAADLFKIDTIIDSLREMRKGLVRARRKSGR